MIFLDSCDECGSLNVSIHEGEIVDNQQYLTVTCRECGYAFEDWENILEEQRSY